MFHRVALALALVSALTGCAGTPKVPLVEHRPGDGAQTHPIPYDATYILQSLDETGAEVATLERVVIARDSQVGFIRREDDTLVAYAGGRKFPLPEGHYVWQLDPATQKTNGDVAQANAGPVIATAGEAFVFTGKCVEWVVVGMLSGLTNSPGGTMIR